MNSGKRKAFFKTVVAMLIMLAVSMEISAAEDIAILTEDAGQEVIAVDFPTLQTDEESPFDFVIDPQNLIYETDAALYGGGVVEEGANLLFHNRKDGAYDFSRYSDNLTVTNRSAVPVMVTISARIDDAEGIRIAKTKDFSEEAFADDSCCVYLALVDDEGNEQPLSEEGEVSIRVEMKDAYSFGLTGECNASENWGHDSVHPKVTVTWHAESVLMEKQEETSEERLSEELEEDVLRENIRSQNTRNKNTQNEDIQNKDIQNEDGTSEDTMNKNIMNEDSTNEDSTNGHIAEKNTAGNSIMDKDDVKEDGLIKEHNK